MTRSRRPDVFAP